MHRKIIHLNFRDLKKLNHDLFFQETLPSKDEEEEEEGEEEEAEAD